MAGAFALLLGLTNSVLTDANRLTLLGTDPITLGLISAIGLMSTFDRGVAIWTGGALMAGAGLWFVRICCTFAVVASASKSVLIGTVVTVFLALFLRVGRREVRDHAELRDGFRPRHLALAMVLAAGAALALPSEYLLRLAPSLLSRIRHRSPSERFPLPT